MAYLWLFIILEILLLGGSVYQAFNKFHAAVALPEAKNIFQSRGQKNNILFSIVLLMFLFMMLIPIFPLISYRSGDFSGFSFLFGDWDLLARRHGNVPVYLITVMSGYFLFCGLEAMIRMLFAYLNYQDFHLLKRNAFCSPLFALIYAVSLPLLLDSAEASAGRWIPLIIEVLLLACYWGVRCFYEEKSPEIRKKTENTGSVEERQTSAVSERPNSAFNELREYKALLDEGILTQEEFDAKKADILLRMDNSQT